jgi:nucleoside-diphosphate-sugar epimerase
MFLVTDVTGHVGRAVLAELANQPVAVRALLQEPVDLPIKAPNIEAVRPDPPSRVSRPPFWPQAIPHTSPKPT